MQGRDEKRPTQVQFINGVCGVMKGIKPWILGLLVSKAFALVAKQIPDHRDEPEDSVFKDVKLKFLYESGCVHTNKQTKPYYQNDISDSERGSVLDLKIIVGQTL